MDIKYLETDENHFKSLKLTSKNTENTLKIFARKDITNDFICYHKFLEKNKIDHMISLEIHQEFCLTRFCSPFPEKINFNFFKESRVKTKNL